MNNKHKESCMESKPNDKHLKLPDGSAKDICSSLTTSDTNVYFSDSSISKM